MPEESTSKPTPSPAPTKPAIAKPVATPAPAPKTKPATTAPTSSTSASPASSAPKAKPTGGAAPAPKPAAKPAEAKPAPKPAAKPAVSKAEKKEGASQKWEELRQRRAARTAGPLPKVVDASGVILGRAASLLAKRLLQGERIAVVNTEKAVVLGGYASLLEEYRLAVARGSVRKGPNFPRRPDRIFRRTVRGMLPFRHTKGREAWARLVTYVGVPQELASLPRETLEGAKPRPSLRPPMTLGEISRHVGGVGPW